MLREILARLRGDSEELKSLRQERNRTRQERIEAERRYNPRVAEVESKAWADVIGSVASAVGGEAKE